ncbi:MAG: hypothetical protein K6F35_06870 [Lachnospiraceae bacterium]|nr:hypothetical protein [Lachnospiraceae bacterium]
MIEEEQKQLVTKAKEPEKVGVAAVIKSRDYFERMLKNSIDQNLALRVRADETLDQAGWVNIVYGKGCLYAQFRDYRKAGEKNKEIRAKVQEFEAKKQSAWEKGEKLAKEYGLTQRGGDRIFGSLRGTFRDMEEVGDGGDLTFGSGAISGRMTWAQGWTTGRSPSLRSRITRYMSDMSRP